MNAIQKHLFLFVIGMCLFSGVGLFIHQDVFDKLPSDYRYWSIFHGVVGQVFLIIFGMSINGHITHYLKIKKKLRWGIVFLLSVVINVITVFFLYYGNLEFREFAHLIHVVMGFGFLISLFCHMHFGKIYRTSLKPKYNY